MSKYDEISLLDKDESPIDSDNPLPVELKGSSEVSLSDTDNTVLDNIDDNTDGLSGNLGYVLKSAAINHAGSGDNTLVSAVVGKKIRVTSILLVSDGTVDVRFEDGAGGTALTGQIPLQEREGFSISNPVGLFETTANTLLNLELSDAVNVHGFVSYYEV